jgi:hypothetical protein
MIDTDDNEYDVRKVGYPRDSMRAPKDGSRWPKFWLNENRPRKSDLWDRKAMAETFVRCSKCIRLLHYSVVGDTCYSCER